MVAQNRSLMEVENNYCEGVVETEGKSASIGTIAGQVFTANLYIASGMTEVSFLVRTRELEDFDPEDGEWTEWMGSEEFSRELQEDHRRRALQ